MNGTAAFLKQEVAKYLPKWEKTTGLYCSSWQSKYMTTKWGTCNPTSKKILAKHSISKKADRMFRVCNLT